MPCSRLGLHAYAPYHGVEWEQYWYESKPGQLPSLFATIAKQLNGATATIAKLVQEEQQRAEEARRQSEIERARWEAKQAEARRQEEERLLREDEARHEKEFRGAMTEWRLARDVREYVAEARAIVTGANFEIVNGGNFDRQMKLALSFAERIDPLSGLRSEIAELVAKRDGKSMCDNPSGSKTTSIRDSCSEEPDR